MSRSNRSTNWRGPSSCASARIVAAERRNWTTSSGVCARSGKLSAIAAVNANIFFGKITSPKPRAPFPAAANRKPDGALIALHFLFDVFFGEIRREPGPAHSDALNRNVDRPRIERDAGISGGGNDAAPVRIRARDGSLDQR